VQAKGKIIVQFEGNVLQTFPLTDATITIGRAPEMTITLPHPLISRAHAELRLEAQGLVVTDLGSSNGSFIGDTRLTPHQPRLLLENMSLRMGPYQIMYQVESPVLAQVSRALPGEQAEQRAPEKATQKISGGGEEQATTALTHATSMRVPQAIQPQPRPVSTITSSLYHRYLPDVYEGNDFLQRFLSIFEDVWEPLEQRQDHIAMYFDPRTCPVMFLPWLASWLGLSFSAHWPEARRRRLLTKAMDLYRWRGTRYGLIRMIEICTGLTPVITENPLEPFIFRIRITLPAEAAEQDVDKALLEELIQTHKPAHVGYILEVNA
jgi:phage tail-like protein